MSCDMTISIHSTDQTNRYIGRRPSKGKSTFALTDSFDVARSDDGGLRITADVRDQIGTARRGGLMRDIRRALTLELSPRDLKRLLLKAVSEGVLDVSFSLAKPKKATRTR